MYSVKLFQKTLSALAATCLFSSVVLAADATVENASFSTFIAATDSFASWNADKDSTGGTRFTIMQDTTGAYSAPGCLKMAITPGADTSTKCAISASITGLPANKIVTISAMVKCENIPSYSSTSIDLMQATQLQVAPWTWTFRKWNALWWAQLGTTGWTPISKTDTTADSANSFTLTISHSNAGTLWIDDITVTYTDLAPVLPRATVQNRQTTFRNDRVSFSRPMAYSMKVCGVNGKVLLQKSGTAAEVNLNRLDLTSGAYMVSVKTAEKTFSGRVMAGK